MNRATSPIDQTRWAPIRQLIAGTFVPQGATSPVRVWRGEKTLQTGMILYRGCRSPSPGHVRDLLTEPRFWTIDESYARAYARTYPDAKLAAFPGFLVTAEVSAPIALADVALYPIAEALYREPKRYGVSQSSPQELQRLHSTAIASAYSGRVYDGVWDHGGREILIAQAQWNVEILAIERIY
jgi:hypothetical protein